MKIHDRIGRCRMQRVLPLMLLLTAWLCAGCSVNRPIGLIYTNIKVPLTENLNVTPVPGSGPNSGRTLEIREPVTGVGISAKVDSNAIGDIAGKHGMQTLYFADQQIFSILGIWNSNRTILYGE